MGEVEELDGFGSVGGKGFFDETRLAVLESEAGVSVVVGMRRGDVDGINLVEELIQVTSGSWTRAS